MVFTMEKDVYRPIKQLYSIALYFLGVANNNDKVSV